MTVEVGTILGHRDDAVYAGRRVDVVTVGVLEASRRRLRRSSAAGADVMIDLDQPAYLADGAVLADDGEAIIAVVRQTEDALVVTFDLAAEPGAILAAALLLGHAFGNQHVGLEVAGPEVRVPITTSADVALGVVDRLGLGLRAVVEPRRLGITEPLCSPPAA